MGEACGIFCLHRGCVIYSGSACDLACPFGAVVGFGKQSSRGEAFALMDFDFCSVILAAYRSSSLCCRDSDSSSASRHDSAFPCGAGSSTAHPSSDVLAGFPLSPPMASASSQVAEMHHHHHRGASGGH